MTAPPSAPVPSPAPPVRRSWSGWRTLLVIVGVLLAVLGGTMLFGGGVGLWAHQQRDADGFFTADSERFTTDAFALSAPSLDVNVTGPDVFQAENLLGDVRIRMTSRHAGAPLFIGVGPTADVARYLAGVGKDEVSDIDVDPFKVTYSSRPGGAPASSPAAQSFWVTSDTGVGPRTLTWDVASGDWTILVMNADGSAGIDADLSAGATLPVLRPVAIGALIVGVVLLTIGVAVIVATVTTRRNGHNTRAAESDRVAAR